MNENELMSILRIIERYQTTKSDILDIIISFRRFGFLEDKVYTSAVKMWTHKHETAEENKRLFYSLFAKVLPLLTFEDFNNVLIDAGKLEMMKAIIAEKNGVTQNWPPKRRLPHTDTVHEFFANLKRCADNNGFQDGTKFGLESIITSLNNKLKTCQNNYSRFQLLVDEKVMAYFLLAQQFSNPDERLGVMQRMRDNTPHNIDRTLFDTIFHSYMAVIWSIKNDARTAESHEQKARFSNQFCLPGLMSIILRLCIQYKNNVFYFRRHQSDDLEHATLDFEEIFQMFDYMVGDPNIYGTIAMLEMVHTLLGIDWDLNVCDINRIRPENIERGKEILSTLQKPSETRRKMLFYLCRARLHETTDTRKAGKYTRKALVLADDGCYYGVEKTNIQNYLDRLSVDTLPAAHL